MIPANDPRWRLWGRTDLSRPEAPRFAYPGLAIEARFRGRSLSLRFADTGTEDRLWVEIDDRPGVVVPLRAEATDYPIADHLGPGVHRLRVVKRTEALCGTVTFLGATIDGPGLGLRPGLPRRRLEFVGDSITCGYGNLVSTLHPELHPFHPVNEAHERSWAHQTARRLGARAVVVAYSGRGVFRNYEGTETGLLPQIYDRVFPDDEASPRVRPEAFRPHAVIINLGTNDLNSQGQRADLTPEAFDRALTDAYRTFLARLRALHGRRTHLVLALGTMLQDDPATGQAHLSRLRRVLVSLVAEAQARGDQRLWWFEMDPQQPPFGEDWHPTAATHARMAAQAASALAPRLGWNDDPGLAISDEIPQN